MRTLTIKRKSYWDGYLRTLICLRSEFVPIGERALVAIVLLLGITIMIFSVFVLMKPNTEFQNPIWYWLILLGLFIIGGNSITAEKSVEQAIVRNPEFKKQLSERNLLEYKYYTTQIELAKISEYVNFFKSKKPSDYGFDQNSLPYSKIDLESIIEDILWQEKLPGGLNRWDYENIYLSLSNFYESLYSMETFSKISDDERAKKLEILSNIRSYHKIYEPMSHF